MTKGIVKNESEIKNKKKLTWSLKFFCKTSSTKRWKMRGWCVRSTADLRRTIDSSRRSPQATKDRWTASADCKKLLKEKKKENNTANIKFLALSKTKKKNKKELTLKK